MIKVVRGNIFATDCDCIVNTINCVGYMGRGIALEVSIRYPEIEAIYKEKCDLNQISIGSLWLYDPEDGSRKVLNFPTKNDYRYPSKIEYLKSGLETFRKEYRTYGIKSIAFPVLGAQNGKLDFEASIKLMKECLSDIDDIDIEIYVFDKDKYERDMLFSDFIKYLGEHENDKKYLELKEAIAGRDDIFTFADMTEKKVSEEQADGTYRRKTIATKPFLQKIIASIKDTKIGAGDSQMTLF